MTTLDDRVDAAADRLQQLADRTAAQGGLKAKLAELLADDAAFLRNLKPSLIKARARGELPVASQPVHGDVNPASPAGPQLGRRPKPGGGGPNPFVVVGAALVAGVLLAKIIDWRGHAHPRR